VLRSITPHILIVGGDPSNGQASGVPVVADRVAGAGALGGLYTALVEAPTEALDDLEVRHLEPDEVAPFNRDGRLLLNVNTPEDYQRVLTLG